MKLILVLGFLAGVAFAQNQRFDSQVFGPKGPVPGASIAVCTQPANTANQPCSPLATLCSSITDAVCTSQNPVTSDPLGNFHFYVKQSQLPVSVQIFGPQVAQTFVMTDQMAGFTSAGNSLSGANTWTGPQTFKAGPWFDVKAYGAAGDGVTNDAAAITAAITAACPSGKCGTVYFPPGSYYIATGISVPFTDANLILRGAGSSGWPVTAGTNATSEIVSDQSITLLTYGDTAHTGHIAPVIRDLGFRDVSAGNNQVAAAISLLRTNYFSLQNISCGDLTVGTCISMDGTGDFTQFGNIVQPKIRNTNIGIKAVARVSSVSIIGGEITPGGTTPYGIDIESGSDGFYIVGININSGATGAGIRFFNAFDNFVAARLENGGGPSGIGVLVDGTGGGTFSSWTCICGSHIENYATGISVTSGASSTTIANNNYLSNTANYSDSGVNTVRFDQNQFIFHAGVGGGSSFRIPPGVAPNTPVAGDVWNQSGSFKFYNGAIQSLVLSGPAPTISSGFGTGPSISGSGTAAFFINVGTGGTATNGVIALPTATNNWNCWTNNITAAAGHRSDNTRQTASTTTSATIENQTTSTGAAIAWTASDIVRVSCFAF